MVVSNLDKNQIYLSFLNDLELSTKFSTCLDIKSHQTTAMRGWQGINSLVCLSDKQEIYDIDIRYGWGAEIEGQNLIDCGWSEATLLAQKQLGQSIRHKLIIYLCKSSTGLKNQQKITEVPSNFKIGSYWQTISHCYLLLPKKHPFTLPEISPQNDRENKFATTYRLTKDRPDFIGDNSTALPYKLFLTPHAQRQGEGGLRTVGLFKQSDRSLPLVSVITVVFNGEKYLEQTIQSIINSTYQNLEYIVIDGGSTDSSLNIIKKYENYIDYWVSEPDNGVYDAMNKGSIAASGDYTLHINADDLLFNAQCLEKVIKQIQKVNQEELSNLLSSILFYRLDKKTLVKKEPNTPKKDPFLNIAKIPGGHQGFLGIRNKHSIFDSDRYRIVAERIVMSEKIKREKITISSITLAIYRSGGISYGINFAMLNEIRKATASSRNPQVFSVLFREYLRLSLLWFGKITGLLILKQKISK